MEIRVLTELVSLMETLSFQETAERMNISQSALSKHIQKVEEELGVSLFDRSTRSVALNQFGKVFYSYAKQMVQLNEDAAAAVATLRDRDDRKLRVAFSPIAASYGVVDVLSEFSCCHPELQLKLTETPRAISVLKANQCDLAFFEESDEIDGSVRHLVYCVDSLVIVLPAQHPLAGRAEVTIHQLREERFILHQNYYGLPLLSAQKFLELCQAEGFEPDVSAGAFNISTMMKMVYLGQGISVVQRSRFPDAYPGLAAVELKPPVFNHIYVLYRNKKKLLPSVRMFLRFLKQNQKEGSPQDMAAHSDII